MCDTADYTYDVLRKQERRARKEHTCCACGERILKGHVYHYSFAYSRDYGDRAEQYKHCLRCAKILHEVQAALPDDAAIAWELNCGEDWRDTIGDLPDDIAALAFLTPEEAQQKLRGATG